MTPYDFLVIGSRVIGLSIARELKARHADARIGLIEKESECGPHVSGSNSGVPHAGFSYSPNGLKAKFTKLVRGWMTAYCERNQIPINRCGKLVSAKDERDLPPLDERPPRKSCDQSQNR